MTNRPLGVSEFAFSPDGRQIAFVAREPEDGRDGTVEGVEPDQRATSANLGSVNVLAFSTMRRPPCRAWTASA